MADKMLRIAGRGDDGTAKPVSTDNSGNVNTRHAGKKWAYGIVTPTAIKGDTSTWKAARGAAWPAVMTDLTSLASAVPYVDGANAAFNTDPIWYQIPIGADGYENFWCNIVNSLGVGNSVIVSAWGVMATRYEMSADITGMLGVPLITSLTLAHGANTPLRFGNGGQNANDVCQWPIGYLILKITPQTDVSAGGLWIGVSRS